jgi:hypothetical protein
MPFKYHKKQILFAHKLLTSGVSVGDLLIPLVNFGQKLCVTFLQHMVIVYHKSK